MTTTYEQLEVWQASYGLFLDVVRLTKTYPQDERYVLAAQMRKAALSVPANIVEGYGRSAAREKVRFYTIAKASAEELGFYLRASKDLGYAPDSRLQPLRARGESVCRMLRRLIQRTAERIGP
ncbi:MAG TPA: four helix bundle protein [Planctomycetota bacterium]|nr:four helix bundle protein [Planctomycetota bacterium]